jgi:hypothetical protein
VLIIPIPTSRDVVNKVMNCQHNLIGMNLKKVGKDESA